MRYTLPTTGYAFKATMHREDREPMESITWIGVETEDEALARWNKENDSLMTFAPSNVEHERALVFMQDNRIADVLAFARIRGNGKPLS